MERLSLLSSSCAWFGGAVPTLLPKRTQQLAKLNRDCDCDSGPSRSQPANLKQPVTLRLATTATSYSTCRRRKRSPGCELSRVTSTK